MTLLKLRSDRLQWIELEGEVVALDEAELTYLAGNGSAALLWPELAAGTTRERLAAILADQFDVDATEVQADVDRFLEDLQSRGLLEAG